MKKYSEKLKDPRWQKKRLEIFKRDDWKCKACQETNESLCVHHLFYFKGKEPWEIHDGFLITLCESCHSATYLEEEEEGLDLKRDIGALLNGIWKAGYNINNILEIGYEFYSSKKGQPIVINR